MATYSVHFFCNECSQVHPVGIQIKLPDGPVERASIGDTYKGKNVPPQLLMMVNNFVQCPNTGKMTLQADNDQIFLVPISD
jgi:hypothetical protein